VSRPGSETRQRIQDVARELFGEKGVQRTSLQDIAGRLGITKPALYYHFRSREDLVRSILQPLIEEGERFIAEQEQRHGSERADARELVEGYFDFHYRHRADLLLAVMEVTTLADLGLIDMVLAWRDRLAKLVFGPRPTLEQSARAIIAFGGLQDCCLQFPDRPYDELRAATVEGALAALGIPGAGPPVTPEM
jgi:AcrR family transcriptional regulator